MTDVLQICANGLPTVRTCDLMAWIKDYCGKETVDMIVVGEPRTMSGEASESMRYIEPFLKQLRREMPDMEIRMHDERFTSAIAHREMLAGGFRKSQRREKGRADEMAAVLILTGFLDSRR